jgi:hypothetical protein
LLAPRDTTLGLEWGPCFKVEAGFERTPETAAAVKEELDRLAEPDGTLDARSVVAAAEPDGSVLHPAFTWDDALAAYRWRIEQAREIIRGVRQVVVVTQPDGRVATSQPVPIYVSFQPDGEARLYRKVAVAMQRPDHASALLREALSEFQALRRRYAALHELGELFDALDRLTQQSEAA